LFRIDGADRRLDELHSRLDHVAIGVLHSARGRASEHHIELGESEHEAVGSIDEHDVGLATQRL
jgi:hypothetical protein